MSSKKLTLEDLEKLVREVLQEDISIKITNDWNKTKKSLGITRKDHTGASKTATSAKANDRIKALAKVDSPRSTKLDIRDFEKVLDNPTSYSQQKRTADAVKASTSKSDVESTYDAAAFNVSPAGKDQKIIDSLKDITNAATLSSICSLREIAPEPLASEADPTSTISPLGRSAALIPGRIAAIFAP